MTKIEKKQWLNEHFLYEFQMMYYAFVGLSDSQDQTKVNINLDCFLLHLRNLLEFFGYGRDKKKKYARAEDFNSNWITIRPKHDPFTKYSNRINTEITHLGYDRKYGMTEDKAWSVGEMLIEYTKIMQSFLINLDKCYLGKPLQNLKKEIEVILDSNPMHLTYSDSTTTSIKETISTL